jgi:hypothetical protein
VRPHAPAKSPANRRGEVLGGGLCGSTSLASGGRYWWGANPAALHSNRLRVYSNFRVYIPRLCYPFIFGGKDGEEGVFAA